MKASPRDAQNETLQAAAVRAPTGDAALHYSNGRLCRNMTPLPLHAAHLRNLDSFAPLRGAADAAALRVLHSDAALHRERLPAEPVARTLFELLEQLRCESLLPEGMPGLAQNLRTRFESWSLCVHRAGVIDGHVGLLLYTVAHMGWSRLTGWPVVEETEGLIEATRAAISPAIGGSLAGMRRTRDDQAAFAVHALELAQRIRAMIDAERAARVPHDNEDKRYDEASRNAFSLFLEFDDGEEEGITLAHTGESRVLHASPQGYRVFTTRYDQELHAGARVRKYYRHARAVDLSAAPDMSMLADVAAFIGAARRR
jgi:cobaltochelatase CobT